MARSPYLRLVQRNRPTRATVRLGLDWFVQAGHGGNGNRNCTLVEDATLDTPAYPYVDGYGPTTTWQNTPAEVGGQSARG
ncbi:MAG: hypothetical protein R3F40_06805 [Candidatus Competibacteraceae bacterium]